MRLPLSALSGILLAVSLVCSSAAAVELDSTLQKIRDSKSISLGYRERTTPFSYVDDKKNVVGYSYELSLRIAEAVRVHLNLATLDIKPIALTVQNRFVLVESGSIDIECTSTTHNLEREKNFSFSNSFFIINTRLMTRKDSGIKEFADLRGKTVVVPAQTTSENLLNKLNLAKGYGMNIISSKDRSVPPLNIMQAGQADAYMHDDAILYGQIANSWRPEEWTVTGKPMSHEAYGCMMRKDATALKAVVDQAIARMMASGEVRALYQKWFMSPTPPASVNLNFPMSPEVEQLLREPNDRALD